MVVVCVSRGFREEWLLDRPVPCIFDLAERAVRLKYEEKIEDAYTALHAAQASVPDMKTYVDEVLVPRTGREPQTAAPTTPPRSI